MTTAQLKKYDRLLAQANACIGRYIEHRFALAKLLKEMVDLCGDVKRVREDLGITDVQVYLDTLEFWGDRRIPTFPKLAPNWDTYKMVARWNWEREGSSAEEAMQAAMKGGRWEIDRLVERLRAEQQEARLKNDPRGVHRAHQEVAGKVGRDRFAKALRDARDGARGVQKSRLSPDVARRLQQTYSELTTQMIRLGLVEPIASVSTIRRAKAAA